MGVEKEAAVRVKLTGDDEIASQTKKISSAWGEIGTKASEAFRGMGSAIGGAVQGVLSDIGHVVSAVGTISFAASVQSVEKFEDSIARLGVASGRSIGSVQQGVNSLAQEIGEMPAATEAWVHSVGDLTYSYERAAQSAKGLQGFALQTAQSLSQVAPLASILDQIGAGGEKAAGALGVMTKQAEMLGTPGGPRALSDMLSHLQGQITNMASGEGPAKMTALLAGFGGNKGFTPQQRERALGGVLGRLEGNVEGFERHFGMKRGALTDEYGHMRNATDVIARLQDESRKSSGMRFRLEQTFGREAAAAIMHTDVAKIREAERALDSNAGGRALDRFKGTPAGQLHQQEIDKDIKMQGAVGAGSFLGGLRRQIGAWSADSPLATMGGMMVAGKLATALPSVAMKAFGLGGAGGAGTTGVGAAAAGVGETAGAVGAGGAGLVGALALGGVGAGMLAQLKVLTELGDASAKKQGFMSKALAGDEAAALSARAAAAKEASYAAMSPGMRQAVALEDLRKGNQGIDRAAALAGGAPGARGPAGPDPKMQAMVDQMVKAGASLQLAQETAAKLLASGQQPIQIEVVNATGGDIDVRPRGKQ